LVVFAFTILTYWLTMARSLTSASERLITKTIAIETININEKK